MDDLQMMKVQSHNWLVISDSIHMSVSICQECHIPRVYVRADNSSAQYQYEYDFCTPAKGQLHLPLGRWP